MKTLTIANSKVKTLDNYCNTSLALNSNSSTIGTLNIFNSFLSLYGKYTCNINIYNSIYLYLNNFSILNSKNIYLIGNNISPLDIVIEGSLDNLTNNLNIYSSGDVNFTTKLITNAILNGRFIKLFLYDKNNYLSSFLLNNPITDNKNSIPIVLYSKNYIKLAINSDVKFIDFKASKGLELTLLPGRTISTFINVNKNTFKFLNTTLDSLFILKNQYPHIIFRIRSLLFNTAFLNGKGTILVPKKIPQPTSVSVLIQNSEYPINIK